MSKWLAIVKQPDGSERELELTPGITFGRHPKSGCVLDDRTVSAEHADIVERDGVLHLRDRGSANHTVVLNGPKLEKDRDYPLQPGMVAMVGKTRITFLLDRQEAPELKVEVVPDAAPTTPSPVGAAANASARAARRSEPSASLPSEQVTVRGPERAAAAATVEAPKLSLPPVAPLEGAPTVPASPPVATPDGRRPHGEPALASAEPALPAVPALPPRKDYSGDGSGRRTVPQAPSGTLDRHAQAAELAAARARLVVDDEAERRVIEIARTEFVVGRSRECAESGCRIDHRGVSSRQARIFMEGSRFFVEDLGSTNGTYAEVEQVRVERREIRSETYLRFGSVAALFVTDLDVTGKPLERDVHERTARMLRRQRRITKSQLARAQEAARSERRHVGEMLIVQGAVDAFTWSETYQKARWMPEEKGMPDKALWWMAGILGLIAVGVGTWLLA